MSASATQGGHNKVRVAMTKLQQLLKQNTNMFGETTAQKLLSDFVQL